MSATSTRRRVLAAATAVSFGTVASAAASAQREDTMPRDQIAATDPDAEIQRLHDAIVAQQAEIDRISAENEARYELAVAHQPAEPVLRVTGMTEQEAKQIKIGDPLTEQQKADFEAWYRLWEAWRAKCDRTKAEHGYVDTATDPAEGQLTQLRDELAETPARTPRGVLLKLRAAVAIELGRECLEDTGFHYANPVVFSVIDDMEAIAGGDHVA
ncbi:hypothetical protein FHP25_13250 [Vineibacter terrae]|uniref:Uncharacterized protein n=1 Tax=Vineibacter terrae TaxID=2586908 RepID=A0A5C8PMX5_9HYPH|nr:hypothetical protein [Vineibacter terrae]TXL75616.1 hypothetical protein FHP25_13250 [Vineibacter terrae]